MRVRTGITTTVYHSYLKFQVTGIAGPVASARLRLFAYDGGDDLSVHPTSNLFADESAPWTESTLTWNNAPAIGPALDQTAKTGDESWVELDVSEQITGDGVYSFGLRTATENSIYLFSKEAADRWPELMVRVAPATSSPATTPSPMTSTTPTVQTTGTTTPTVQTTGTTTPTVQTTGTTTPTVQTTGHRHADRPDHRHRHADRPAHRHSDAHGRSDLPAADAPRRCDHRHCGLRSHLARQWAGLAPALTSPSAADSAAASAAEMAAAAAPRASVSHRKRS